MARWRGSGMGDRVEEVCGYVVYLEVWWLVWPLVQQEDSAWVGSWDTLMRKGVGFGDNIRGDCWERGAGQQVCSLPGLLVGMACCSAGGVCLRKPREWRRPTETLTYFRWLKSCRFIYYSPNENIFANINVCTWSWSEASILISQ